MSQLKHQYIDVCLLKNQIQEAIDIMQEWKEKKAENNEEEQWIEGYCQGLQYVSELASFLVRKTKTKE